MKTNALVIVDMQNDFITGSLGSVQAVCTVEHVLEKIKAAQAADIPIFVTRDTHDENYLHHTLEGAKLPVIHCVENSDGWQIHPVLRAQLEKGFYFTVDKPTFGAKHLADDIKDVCELSGHDDKEMDEIEVCGLCTDICVITNVALLRTAFPNTTIKVDSKACAGTSMDAHNAALTVMRSIQVDVI